MFTPYLCDCKHKLKNHKEMRKSTVILLACMACTGTSAAWAGDSPQDVPYHEMFDTEELGLNGCVATDSNGDGDTWSWNYNIWNGPKNRQGQAEYWYRDGKEADDWLQTPEISLGTDCDYRLEVRFAVSSPLNLPDKMQLYIGKGDDLTQYTPLAYDWAYENQMDKFYSRLTTTVAVEDEGDYRLAFHINGQYDELTWIFVMMDYIKLDVNSSYAAPASVTDLTATPGAEGSNKVTLAFSVPSTTYGGQPLTSLARTEIWHSVVDYDDDGKEVSEMQLMKTLEAPVPGEAVTIECDEPTGMAHYRVMSFNEAGQSVVAEAECYVGVDVPLKPENVRLMDNGTCLRMTWDPVTAGVHGGYIDPDEVVYRVFDEKGAMVEYVGTFNEWDSPEMQMDGPTTQHKYGVSAYYGDGISELAMAFPVITGDTFELPFMETFSTGVMDHPADMWCTSNIPYYGFGSGMGLSADGDGGSTMALANNYNKDSIGNVLSIATPKLKLKGVDNPVLSFYYFGTGDQETPSTMTVSVIKDGREEQELMTQVFDNEDEAFLISQDIEKTNGWWKKASYSLADYKDCDYVIVKFGATVMTTNQAEIHLDQIYVRDVPEHNLELSLSAPSEVWCGEQVNAVLKVRNTGANAAKGFTVTLDMDGENAHTITPEAALEPDATTTFIVPFTPTSLSDDISLEAKLTYDPDMNQADNSAKAAVVVKNPDFPKPGNVVIDGNTLSWTAPEIGDAQPTTDDFESYQPWNTCFGDWQSIDLDGEIPLGDNSFAFPIMGQKNSFFVFRPDEVDSAYADHAPQYIPNSGEQMLTSFDTDSWQAKDSYSTNDWLVSPRLSGRAQTVRFFAKSYDTNAAETVYFGYSMGGSNIGDGQRNMGDFVLVKDPETGRPFIRPSGAWTEYTADLPEGATYFAIANRSQECWMLAIDDVTYESITDYVELMGYNIYRNGHLVGNVSVDTTSFELAGDRGDYQVTALYRNGESRPTEPVTSGISEIRLSHDAVFYNLMGQRVENPANGIFIVRDGGRTFKVRR